MTEGRERLLLLDGHSILFRSYYALAGRRAMSAPDGTPTHAVFAFCQILLKHLEEERPTHVAVAFDRPEPTFRHAEYSEYKAGRRPTPPDLLVQVPLLRDVLDALRIPSLEIPGFEADDVLGTLSRIASERGADTRILTGDRDALQLVDARVQVLFPANRGGKPVTDRMDEAAILDRYGLSPRQLIDVKAIMGDPSDNLPGVRGIGEKGALELIFTYGSLDRVYASLDRIRPALAARLAESREQAAMTRRLAEIDRQVPIDISWEAMAYEGPDPDRLASVFRRLGFRNLAVRFGVDGRMAGFRPEDPVCGENGLRIVPMAAGDDSDAAPWRKATQPDSPGFGVTLAEDILYVATPDGTVAEIRPRDAAWRHLREHRARVAAADGKGLLKQLESSPGGMIEASEILFDVRIAAFLLDQETSRRSIDDLCRIQTGEGLRRPADRTEGGTGTSAPMAAGLQPSAPQDLFQMAEALERADADVVGNRSEPDSRTLAAAEADAVLRLAAAQRIAIGERGLVRLSEEIEQPLVGVLAAMETVGFRVDPERLRSLSGQWSARADVLRRTVLDLAGTDFNLNSTRQLADVLFKRLGLSPGRKTSNGFSTDSDVLEGLLEQHPIIRPILDYRQLTKLGSTFLDGLMRAIRPDDGRVHTTFNQTGAATGRLSSSDPNLQNIPVRMEEGREIRKAFVAEPGWRLIDADYSQIELRLLAHLSREPAMIDAFRNGEDIHLATACRVFGLPPEAVTPSQRGIAKTVNFSIVYGISDFGLSRDLGIPVREARHYIDGYHALYPGVRRYFAQVLEQAAETGWVETLLGRRRRIPELSAENRSVRSFGERAAMNTPVQGTAADLMKLAMVRAARGFLEAGLRARLVLQVHDELIVEAPVEEVPEASRLLRQAMEQVESLLVPLRVDIASGSSWHDAKA